ncbi:MAG: class I SAM-dependent DNA methyltransferase [Acidimicrobiales bacterium]
MATDLVNVQKKLWDAADELRANSGLQASEYSGPVLGLIFLRFAEQRFAAAENKIGPGSERRPTGPDDYKAEGVLFLPAEARYPHLLKQPEGVDLGKLINDAMAAIESHNPDLRGVLPKVYSTLPNSVLIELLRTINTLADDIEGDSFGLVYEYFLAQFAMAEGQGGGEFFTPPSIVKLIVEIIEPYNGKIYDPACGSGGMFVQSADFVARHQGNPGRELSIYGQEASRRTVPLAKMNLAVHGLGGDILEGNTYYDDRHDCVDKFDFVMANPPFNVNKVDKAKLEDDIRFRLGLPSTDNANYLWIQTFYSALNGTGRAGFVMANSASDARGSEMEIRRKLIEDRVVDVIVAVGTNMFFTVTLPVTLWFLDKGKRNGPRADEVLFIDAREIYNTIDRAHRDWTPQQIEFLSNIVRLWRGEVPEFEAGSRDMIESRFPSGQYENVAGLCGVSTVDDIETQGWSLNPGRFVGVDHTVVEGSLEDLKRLLDEYQDLDSKATTLSAQVAATMRAINV